MISECLRRKKRAEGGVFNPFVRKAEKKVLSYGQVESQAGQLADSRFPHPRPCMEMLPAAQQDPAGGFSIFFTLAA